MAFHLGSLGFLTPFKFDTYQSQVTQIIEGKAAVRWKLFSIPPVLLCSGISCQLSMLPDSITGTLVKPAMTTVRFTSHGVLADLQIISIVQLKSIIKFK